MPGEERIVNLKTLKFVVGYKKFFSEFEYRLTMEKFARACDATKVGYYDKRGQKNRERREVQSVFGKLSEQCVYESLFKYGCSEPNYKVLEKPSYDSDLYLHPYRIHVKSVEWPGPHGMSFTFQHQPSDPGGVDDLFKKGNDHDIIFCCAVINDSFEFNKRKWYIEIVGCFEWPRILPHLTFIDGEDKEDLKDSKLFLHEKEFLILREEKL